MPTPEQSYRTITLTQGQVVLVDAEDFDRINSHKWCADWSEFSRSFYAMRKEQGKTVRMHREVMRLASGDSSVDHINHETLDNRRSNLRIATKQNNAANARFKTGKTGFRGVRPCGSRFEARINVSGRTITLGRKDTAEAAYALYCDAARKYFGEFACLSTSTTNA